MAAESIAQQLEPEQIARIKNLSIRAKLIVEGLLTGLHRSPYHGFSAEFSEFRHYFSGESIRNIDWRVYAKSDRTVVRLYEDETNCFVHILMDKSGSMEYRSADASLSKYEYGSTLAAALAWLFIRQRDAVGLSLFDTELRHYIPPRSTSIHLNNILAFLHKSKPAEQTRCGDALFSTAKLIKKRGMCIVLSDFLDEPEAIIRGLKHLRYKRQDLIVFRIADPHELEFKARGPLRIRDLETRREIKLDGATAAHYLREGIEKHRDAITRACHELGADIIEVSTTEPLHRTIIRTMERRSRLQ